jgi:hypothetical protein
MKTFIIPAFFIVKAENEEYAYEKAAILQSAAIDVAKDLNFLLFDEGLPAKEIVVDVNGDLPHTYKDYL